jgi:hypothetical protein
MSKGEIVSHIADGKYRVRQKLAAERVKEEIAALEKRIAELAIDVPAAKLELLQANNLVSDKARAIDLLIPDLQAGVDGTREKIKKLQVEMAELSGAAQLSELKASELIAENLSVLKRRAQLEAVPEGRELELWCADYTLNLSGDVGLVDVNDEGGQGLVIQPGFSGDAAYSAQRDGALFPNIAQSGPQVFFNAAILPGVQRWLPRYRVGEITRLQADVCTVRLGEAKSSAQDLPINEAETLVDIPIVYMDCNGSAFKIGDRVLVRFTASGPLVIGFEMEPVPCSLFGFVFEPAKYDGTVGTQYVAQKETYGEPFESSGTPINPPLGTAGGTNNAWTAIQNASDLVIERGKARNYGNKNWFNSEKLVLSWSGPPGRAHRLDQIDVAFSGFLADWKTEPYVFHDLKIILDLSAEAEAGAFNRVFGAALNVDAQGQRWLMVVASDVGGIIPPDSRGSESGQSFRVFRAPVDAVLQKTGPLELLHQHSLAVERIYQSHFYFSASGDKAVCTIVGDVIDEANLKIELLRYDISTGFSVEEIWTRNQSVGMLTVEEVYDVQSDTPVLGNITTVGDLYRSYQTGNYLIPIYCDFVGDREVVAYERHAAIDSVRTANYHRLEANGQFVYTASGSLAETHQAPFSVVTSDSNTLFQMPYKADKQRSISYESGRPDNSYFRVTDTHNSRFGGIAWEENLLAIDVRFDFCAVTYGGYQYALDATVDTTWDDPELKNTGSASATGSITGNEIVEVVEFWVNGAMVKQEEALRIPGPMEITAYSSDPRPTIGITGSNSSTQSNIKPLAPMQIGSKYLLTAAGYSSGPHSIGAVAMNYRTGATTRKPVILNHVSGYSDPVQEILERVEQNGFMLCSVGLL